MALDNRNISDDMSEGFLNEFKERMAVDPLENSVKQTQKSPSRKQGYFVAGLIILAIAAALCWNFYSSYMSGGKNGEVPLLKADNAPLREKPTNAGGMEVADMDKLVYGRVGDADSGEGNYEQVLPTAEKPSAPPAPLMDSVKVKAENVPAPAPATTTATAAVPAVTPAPEVSRAKTMPAPKPVATVSKAKAPLAAPASSSASSASAAGAFRVQLVALKDKDAALKAWADALKKHKALLSPYDYEIIEVAVAGKGTLYRLRIKSFPSRAAANQLCSQLKAAGQSCVVATAN